MSAKVSEIDRLRGLIAELRDTELAEIACTGSNSPVEDVLGRLFDAIAQPSGAIEVTVRLSCGAYLASGAGKRVSCTMSSEQAALRLAQKLWPGAGVRCELLECVSPSVQRYRVSWQEPKP